MSRPISLAADSEKTRRPRKTLPPLANVYSGAQPVLHRQRRPHPDEKTYMVVRGILLEHDVYLAVERALSPYTLHIGHVISQILHGHASGRLEQRIHVEFILRGVLSHVPVGRTRSRSNGRQAEKRAGGKATPPGSEDSAQECTTGKRARTVLRARG